MIWSFNTNTKKMNDHNNSSKNDDKHTNDNNNTNGNDTDDYNCTDHRARGRGLRGLPLEAPGNPELQEILRRGAYNIRLD